MDEDRDEARASCGPPVPPPKPKKERHPLYGTPRVEGLYDTEAIDPSAPLPIAIFSNFRTFAESVRRDGSRVLIGRRGKKPAKKELTRSPTLRQNRRGPR